MNYIAGSMLVIGRSRGWYQIKSAISDREVDACTLQRTIEMLPRWVTLKFALVYLLFECTVGNVHFCFLVQNSKDFWNHASLVAPGHGSHIQFSPVLNAFFPQSFNFRNTDVSKVLISHLTEQ